MMAAALQCYVVQLDAQPLLLGKVTLASPLLVLALQERSGHALQVHGNTALHTNVHWHTLAAAATFLQPCGLFGAA
jgi:hypothetical protein